MDSGEQPNSGSACLRSQPSESVPQQDPWISAKNLPSGLLPVLHHKGYSSVPCTPCTPHESVLLLRPSLHTPGLPVSQGAEHTDIGNWTNDTGTVQHPVQPFMLLPVTQTPQSLAVTTLMSLSGLVCSECFYIIQDMAFCVWLLPSGFIHMAVCVNTAPPNAVTLSCIYTAYTLLYTVYSIPSTELGQG